MAMDVKIGLADNPRELVISTNQGADEVAGQVSAALANENGLLDLTDAKGHRFVVRVARIAYVEIGIGTPRSVGFVGA